MALGSSLSTVKHVKTVEQNIAMEQPFQGEIVHSLMVIRVKMAPLQSVSLGMNCCLTCAINVIIIFCASLTLLNSPV